MTYQIIPWKCCPSALRAAVQSIWRPMILLLWLSSGWALQAQTVQDTRSAVVLIYHRFGEARYPTTNITLAQFEAHLDYLAENGFTVVPIKQITDAMKTGTALPDRSVAITVDDAYASFMTEAWPRLKARGFPAALFVATEAVDGGYDGILSWDQIRQLQADGVTIGHHGHGHIHMVDEGLNAAVADIQTANTRFQAELGAIPPIFAYPYGEYSLELRNTIEAMGFSASLAQYSAAVGLDDDVFAIPRFALNERFGDATRFRLLAQSRALPAEDIVPRDGILWPDSQNPPAYGFTLSKPVAGLSAMNCFSSNQRGRIEPMILNDRRVEIRLQNAFAPGRHRITCTLPGPGGRWYWRGKFFYVPGAPD